MCRILFVIFIAVLFCAAIVWANQQQQDEHYPQQQQEKQAFTRGHENNQEDGKQNEPDETCRKTIIKFRKALDSFFEDNKSLRIIYYVNQSKYDEDCPVFAYHVNSNTWYEPAYLTLVKQVNENINEYVPVKSREKRRINPFPMPIPRPPTPGGGPWGRAGEAAARWCNGNGWPCLKRVPNRCYCPPCDCPRGMMCICPGCHC